MKTKIAFITTGGTISKTVTITVAGGTTPVATEVYRINCGGTALTDSRGKLWQADQYFNTGKTYATTVNIAGSSDPKLYQSSRYDEKAATGDAELKYSLPVANGAYTVELHFADSYAWAAGVRVFDVKVENALAIDNLDIFAAAGGMNRALVKTVATSVGDGQLNIEFIHQTQNPLINAIRVLREP